MIIAKFPALALKIVQTRPEVSLVLSLKRERLLSLLERVCMCIRNAQTRQFVTVHFVSVMTD